METIHLNWLGTTLFALAVAHTFSIKFFHNLALRFPEGSKRENLFHLLGEVEVIFGIWAGIFFIVYSIFGGMDAAIHYVEGQNFTEPLFVFVIMAIAATRPVLFLADRVISGAASLLPIPRAHGFYFACLLLGPLLGSFITEPAAMTVTAILLKRQFFDKPISPRLRYGTLAVLFVNISIGGVLTHFAAPPVVMVAQRWGWDTPHMLAHFGWKAVLAVVLNAVGAMFYFRRELQALSFTASKEDKGMPLWMIVAHALFLFFVVLTSHHATIFIGLFLFFLGFSAITQEYQDELKLRESLLVAFFLGGLVVLGGLQSWWLDPVLQSMGAPALFGAATALTAITDNAALTYLGAQVPNLPDALKYALVAGAVSGGGLTVIANAPNPAGFSILQSTFGSGGINPVRLLLFALIPTVVAMICFWLLPY